MELDLDQGRITSKYWANGKNIVPLWPTRLTKPLHQQRRKQKTADIAAQFFSPFNFHFFCAFQDRVDVWVLMPAKFTIFLSLSTKKRSFQNRRISRDLLR